MNLFHLNYTCLLRTLSCLGSPPCSHPYIFLNRYFFMPRNNSCKTGVLHISFQLARKLILNVETEVCLRVFVLDSWKAVLWGQCKNLFHAFHLRSFEIIILKQKRYCQYSQTAFDQAVFICSYVWVFFFFWKSLKFPQFGSWWQTLETVQTS